MGAHPSLGPGRHCEYCGKPGGPSHAIQMPNGQMKTFYVHRQCYRKLVAKIGKVSK